MVAGAIALVGTSAIVTAGWFATGQVNSDSQSLGFILGGIAAIITAVGGLILALRGPRKDPAEELLLIMLAEQAGIDLEAVRKRRRWSRRHPEDEQP